MAKTASLLQAVDRISIMCLACDEFVVFEYTGKPEDLIAARAIEPAMAEAGRKGTMRCDSHGDRFYRTKLASGLIRIKRFITDSVRAKKMPGALNDLSTPTLAWLHEQRGKVKSIAADPSWVEYAGSRAALVQEGHLNDELFSLYLEKPRHNSCVYLAGRFITQIRNGFWVVSWHAGAHSIRDRGTHPNEQGLKRDRYVGRSQRHAVWRSDGNILFIDWAGLVAERIVSRNS